MEDKIVILGGGVASLGAAYHLVKNNLKPIIIEKGSGIGGLASSYRISNFHIERFYHHFFPTDTLVFDIAKKLGIKNKILWKNTKMGFYYKNTLYGFTTPFDIMLFKPLSIINRIKFGLQMLKIAKNNGDYGRLDNVGAKEWLIETFGSDIYEKIFRSMLEIKFAMSLDKASAAFVYGRLHARAKSRSKNLVSEKLGYMEGGYNELISSLYDKIKDNSKILHGSEILEVLHDKYGYRIKIIRNSKTEVIDAKYVINTLPLEIFAKIGKNLPKGIESAIKKVKYQAVICATIGIKKKLSGYYWINISSADLPFHGVIEHTNFIPASYYGGNNIIYLFNYLSPENKLWNMKEEEIKKIYLSGLFKMFPHIKDDDVLWFRLSKERYATPVFLKGYEENMKKIENFSNMYFAGSFKIYPYSRNVNNVIKTGIEAAKEVLRDMTK